MEAQEFQQLIERYIKDLKEKQYIRSSDIERAFRRVQRHQLLKGFYELDEHGEEIYWGRRYRWQEFDRIDPALSLLSEIYSDRALLTHVNPPSSTSEPGLLAKMLEFLELKQELNVLEIGAGTGYMAALLAEIVGNQTLVATIDIQADVVEQTSQLLKQAGYGDIHISARDGFYGCPDHAPYDRIVASVGCSDISPHWIDQLAPKGFMLIPLQHGGMHYTPLTRIWRVKGRILGHVIDASGFMPIQGALHTAIWVPIGIRESLPLSQKEPEKYPLFPSLAQAKQAGDWALSSGFHYFLASRDYRTFYNQYGIGLWDQEKGAIVIRGDQILLYGDEELYHELSETYERWEALGEPKASDYQIEFVPMESNSEGLQREVGANIWVIKRKFHQQIIQLEGTAA